MELVYIFLSSEKTCKTYLAMFFVVCLAVLVLNFYNYSFNNVTMTFVELDMLIVNFRDQE